LWSGWRRLPSPQLRAFREEIDRIEGGRAADKQAVQLGTAEGHVADYLGDMDLADQRAVLVDAVDALGGAAPDAVFRVDAESIEQAGRRLGEDFAAAQLLAVDPEAANVLRAVLDVGH